MKPSEAEWFMTTPMIANPFNIKSFLAMGLCQD
jgi:hypothetical protein